MVCNCVFGGGPSISLEEDGAVDVVTRQHGEGLGSTPGVAETLINKEIDKKIGKREILDILSFCSLYGVEL